MVSKSAHQSIYQSMPHIFGSIILELVGWDVVNVHFTMCKHAFYNLLILYDNETEFGDRACDSWYYNRASTRLPYVFEKCECYSCHVNAHNLPFQY